MAKNAEGTLTAALLEELKSLQAALRRQWGYMRTMISSEGTEVLKGSGNLVSATGYAVCNALVSSSRFIQENMDQSGEEDDAISTPPEEMTLITATKDTHGACDGAKPMVDARVTAKLAELEAMEREEKRRRVIREWTQQEIQIELASAKLKKVFSSHNNGIQLTVSRIRNFLLNTDDAVSLNLGELLHLELLQTDLRDQFHGMTTEWDIRRTDPEAELAFSEVENCVGIATRAVEKALRDSDAFLEVKYLTELELHQFDETVLDEAVVNCCVNEEIITTMTATVQIVPMTGQGETFRAEVWVDTGCDLSLVSADWAERFGTVENPDPKPVIRQTDGEILECTGRVTFRAEYRVNKAVVVAWVSPTIKRKLWVSFHVQRDLGMVFVVPPEDFSTPIDPEPGDRRCKLLGIGADSGVEPRFMAPFFMEWKREAVLRQTGNIYDVYYIPPQSGTTRVERKKSQSVNELRQYLEDFPSGDLTEHNLSFQKVPLGLNNEAYEIIRPATRTEIRSLGVPE